MLNSRSFISQSLNQTLCSPERFYAQVDEIAAALRPAVQEESEEKVARFDQVVAGKGVAPAGFGGGFRRGGPRFGGGPFMEPVKPIKGFVNARHESVAAQLAGKSGGETLPEFGFGGRGGPRGQGRGGGPGFGAGNFLGNAFMEALDTDHDGTLTREEVLHGFQRWFRAWDTEKAGALTEEQIRAGMNQALAPGGFGRPMRPEGEQ
jgi:hypothetical protein